jgi:hypothetical protein
MYFSAFVALTLGLSQPSMERRLCPAMHPPAPPMEAPVEKPAFQQSPDTTPTPLIVTIGSTVRLQMKSKRSITRVVIDREGIISVRPEFNDQSTLLITGLKPGVARLSLWDDTGRREDHQWGK